MAKRIEVTPASDGTIVLVCGDEELVLVIKGHSAPSPVRRTVDPDRLYTYALPPRFELKNLDGIVEKIAYRHDDPDTPHVKEVLWESPLLDVHKVAGLADRLNDRLPSLDLHVDLCSKLDPG